MAANQRIIIVSRVSYEALRPRNRISARRDQRRTEHTVGSRSVGPVNNAQVGDAKGIRQKITDMKMRLIKDALRATGAGTGSVEAAIKRRPRQLYMAGW